MALLTIQIDNQTTLPDYILRVYLDTCHKKFGINAVVPRTASPAIIGMLVQDSLAQLFRNEEVLKLLTPTLPEA